VARGIKGKARFWRDGKATHDLEMDMERGAVHALVEEDKGGFRWRKYREFPDALGAQKEDRTSLNAPL